MTTVREALDDHLGTREGWDRHKAAGVFLREYLPAGTRILVKHNSPVNLGKIELATVTGHSKNYGVAVHLESEPEPWPASVVDLEEMTKIT